MSISILHSIGALESHLYWHSHPSSDEQTPLELTHHQSQQLTRHLYGRQTRDGEIIIGGDRQLDAPKAPDRDGIETNRAHVLDLFSFLQDFPIARTWAGWMPFTRDLHPLIGQIPRFSDLYLLTGLSSSGFEKELMSGKLLAELITHGAVAPILFEE